MGRPPRPPARSTRGRAPVASGEPAPTKRVARWRNQSGAPAYRLGAPVWLRESGGAKGLARRRGVVRLPDLAERRRAVVTGTSFFEEESSNETDRRRHPMIREGVN